jgi:Fe-S-cluster containining protein
MQSRSPCMPVSFCERACSRNEIDLYATIKEHLFEDKYHKNEETMLNRQGNIVLILHFSVLELCCYVARLFKRFYLSRVEHWCSMG